MSSGYLYREMLPFAAMVARECCTVGGSILFKAASLKGMSFYVFLTYTFILSSFAILPFIFIFPSSAVLPSSKSPLISKICLLGSLGFFALFLGFKGVEYSSPTLGSALSNLTPVFTFILAVIFRLERIAFRRSSSQAKIIGTIVSISGALVVVFYKGPTVFSLASLPSDWLIGGLMLAAGYLLFSVWYIILTQVLKIYPAKFLVIMLFNLCSAIISIPGVGLTFVVVETWCVHLKGPVYVTSFRPLSFPIAAAMSALFLGDALHLGSVIGAVIISIGFYAVLWGKAKEEERTDDESRLVLTSLPDDQLPLLQSCIVEDGEKAGK